MAVTISFANTIREPKAAKSAKSLAEVQDVANVRRAGFEMLRKRVLIPS